MAIGHSYYRIDALGKVTGATPYPGDLTPEKLLYAKVLFSNRPHARMVAMDLKAAKAVSGVVGIFTAQDVPVNERRLAVRDQPVLVGLGNQMPYSDVSRWEGDQVAIIVAESEEGAAEARDLIRIEWEDLPLVPDVDSAIKDECLLHPSHGSNILQHSKIRKGDMAAGWDAADVIIEGTYQVPYQEHAYLQPEAALSYVDKEGRITVQVAGQWTHKDQLQVAHALGLPLDKVRIIYPAIGGAFGGREDATLQIVMALATWRLSERGEMRPIRAIWTREESIIGHPKRHRVSIKTRWGATKEGRLTAVFAEAKIDAGAYNCSSSTGVASCLHISLAGPYQIPNAHLDTYAVYTNNVPGSAFRGFGIPQAAFVAENQMNKLAVALGIDPVEIRLKNVLRDGSEFITQTIIPKGVSLPEVIEKCAAEAGWHNRLHNPSSNQHVPGGKRLFKSMHSLPPHPSAIRRGCGLACGFKNIAFSFGFPERCEATIELHGGAEIERVVLYHAGADLGQGAHTAFKQMVAQAIGVSVKQVELMVSDTANSGDSGASAASRLTWMAGNAIQGAAQKAKEAWRNEDRPAIGHFRYVPPPTESLHAETGVGFPAMTYGYVAEYVEIAVDIETGHINLERVLCANDVGKAINPNLIEGQIEGAVVQAVGYAVTENLQVKNGHILNPRFSTYLIPGIRDIPQQVESLIMEIPDPLGPWGVRGMAEMPFIPLSPAMTAALYDATGVWFDEIPLTPSRVVAKLREHGIGAL